MDKIKQMDINYHREMKNNYLMITVDEAREQSFEARMLIGNTIDGLLKFRIRKSDNQCQFCYEITSRQPLGRLLETKAIGAEQLRILLLGIAQTVTGMDDYLLTEEQILLDPEFIYVDLESFQPGLCLLPGRMGDFPREFNELLRFLLGKVDHRDKEAVVLVYGLYRESLKDNYGLENVLRWVIKEGSSGQVCGIADKEEAQQQGTVQTPDTILRQSEPTEAALSENNDFVRAPEFPKKAIAAWSFSIPMILIIFWLQKGMNGVYWYVTSGILGIIILISAIGIGFAVWRWRKISLQYMDAWREDNFQKYADSAMDTKQTSWETAFCDEESEYEKEESADEDMHTVLLWSRESNEEQRRLISENRMTEQIVIAYYPFLIGKQENLVDYVIRDDTVSRLHVRIDRNGEEYFLTDLNSTNGTSVNDRRLETNETVKLDVGDRVEIAHLVYRFQ